MSTILDRTKSQNTAIADHHSKGRVLFALCWILVLILCFRDMDVLLPFIFYSTLLPLVPVVVFLYFVLQGCFSPKGLLHTETAKWLGVIAVLFSFWLIVSLEILIPSSIDSAHLWTYEISYLLLPAWVLVGFWLGAYPIQIKIFSWKFAKFLAVTCLIFTFLQNTVGFLGVFRSDWWLITLTFLFAYFWFFYEVIVREGPGWYGSLFGLICSSSQVIFPIHKPIVWAAAIGTLVLLLLAIVRRDFTFKRFFRLVALLGLIVVILVSINLYTDGRFFGVRTDSIITLWFHANPENFSGIEITDEQSLNTILGNRIIIWRGVWYRFDESPLIGSGFGQDANDAYIMHIHSFFLDLILGTGILGSLPIILGLLLWFFSLFRKNRSTSPSWVVPFSAFVISILAYGLIGNFALFFYAPSFLAPLMIGMTLRQ